MVDISRELQVALNTGKVIIGFEETKKAVLAGTPKLVILAANAPKWARGDIEYYAKLAGVPVFIFPGSSIELGAAAKRPHKIMALAVLDPGQSEILKVVEHV
ncbi:50S ribosomal protein L30e [Pyrobaculum neutrophilum]|uniref:Large ribosomal subunit protein eL30 n=1 Tax=Pyrobaculum neutrophilum (strain DSM 2338 / JCM 9278 / NBRC 100436 / V24Sta) TaxID=444157 RepID=RL30E_PYRNV|nr:50S ribosomal protein L30e [Pyrobaculum neutrophilum]B1YC27.1 RecName: Full=Large ribosomal subunit protein eL30; AltName: Full=50S ribosomal protein L30e [Pyrobaculum neutrophilum V24Sta]ACB40881.1 ribosomal protein L7Ae/L30e/S12e/Gadd45 [Pyrobaculum neutrophilum V24Sta]